MHRVAALPIEASMRYYACATRLPRMDEHMKDFFKFAKSSSLSHNERISMRNVLKSVIAEHPIRPRIERSYARTVLSFFDTHSLRPVSYALVFVLVLGVGTSYAAEQALPGDPLYAVKVNFTEPLQGVLAVSPVAKAEWNTELVSRRLEEAALLAAKGTLNGETRAAIESQVIRKAEAVAHNADEIRSRGDGGAAAVAVESQLEASLVGHERVLTGLSVDMPAQAPAIAPILHKVRAKAQETNSKRKSVERELAADNGEKVKRAATEQKRAARERVQEVRALAASKNLMASTSLEARTSALHMEQAISEGEKKLEEGKYEEAFGTFQAAIRAAKAVEVNLDVEEKILGEIRSGHSGDGSDD